MKEIPIFNSDLVAYVDDDDFERVSKRKWYLQSNANTHYAVTKIDGKNALMHRFILCASRGTEVDHLDHNGLMNVRSNLRLCSRTENSRNKIRHKEFQCPYKGVSRSSNGKRFKSMICIDGKLHYIGTYDTAEDAARAYDCTARKHFKEFASCNFPDEHAEIAVHFYFKLDPKRVRQARGERSLSQMAFDVGNAVGRPVSIDTMRSWERRPTRATREIFEAFCKVVDKPQEFFL